MVTETLVPAYRAHGRLRSMILVPMNRLFARLAPCLAYIVVLDLCLFREPGVDRETGEFSVRLEVAQL